jgi:hypothetical protein
MRPAPSETEHQLLLKKGDRSESDLIHSTKPIDFHKMFAKQNVVSEHDA